MVTGRAGRWATAALAMLLVAGTLRADEVPASAPSPEAMLRDRVASLLRDGDRDGAVSLSASALEAKPDDPWTSLLYGWALVEAGRPADAVPPLEVAVKGLPGDVHGWNNLACALLDLRRDAEAEKALARARELGSGMGEVHNNRGVLLERRGRTVEAEEAFREALSRQPDLAKAHNNLGALLFETGREAEALPHFVEAARIDASYASPRINLGVVALVHGDDGEAERLLREAAARPDARAEAHFNLALLAMRKGDGEGARKALERALELRPEDADILNNLGVAHLLNGAYRLAEGYLQRAVKVRPDFAQAWSNLGLAQHHMAVEADSDDRLLARAERSFLRETDLRPDAPWGYYNLGTVRLARSRLDEAEAAFRRAVSLAPKHVEALNNLGCVLDLRSVQGPADPMAALRCYQDALVIDPDFIDAHRNIATWYATVEGHQDFEKALEHWRIYRRLTSDDPAAQQEAAIAIDEVKTAQIQYNKAHPPGR